LLNVLTAPLKLDAVVQAMQMASVFQLLVYAKYSARFML